MMDKDIKKLLLELYTDWEADNFYHSTNDLLGGKSAKWMVENGRKDEVIQMLNRIIDGVYI